MGARSRGALCALGAVALVGVGCSRDGLEGAADGGVVGGAGHDLARPVEPDAPDLASVSPPPDLAVSTCRRLEVDLTPAAGDLQIVVWLEDGAGRVVDTLYVTEATGRRGLGNRPGAPLLGSTVKFPEGRREMVAPVWAHRRNHAYPRVVAGNACPYGPPDRCPNAGVPCGDDCDERAWVYVRNKSFDDFYCSPVELDMRSKPPTCPRLGSVVKGHYAAAPAASLYPPRADVGAFFDKQLDSPDVLRYAADNDLAAVSAATPPANAPLRITRAVDTAMRPDGEYTLWVEASAERDENDAHHYQGDFGQNRDWFFLLSDFLGQPSVLYRVPLRQDGAGGRFVAAGYAGYGSWDGSDGTLRPPDATITSDKPGSGALRLAGGRVTVTVRPCGP